MHPNKQITDPEFCAFSSSELRRYRDQADGMATLLPPMFREDTNTVTNSSSFVKPVLLTYFENDSTEQSVVCCEK